MDNNMALLKDTLNTVAEKIHSSTGEINGEITDFSIILGSIVRDLNVLSAQMQQQIQLIHTCDKYMQTIDTLAGNTDTSIKIVLQNIEKTNALSMTGTQNLQQTRQELEGIFFSTQKNQTAKYLPLLKCCLRAQNSKCCLPRHLLNIRLKNAICRIAVLAVLPENTMSIDLRLNALIRYE